MKGKILKIILIFVLVLFVYNIKIFAVESGTVRMKITGDTAWVNINVSDAYAECESLNSSTSTLGTTALKAHLTTDADWSAMAIFSISQYGGATSNEPSQTNGNGSGIYGIATASYSTGILETATKTTNHYISGLFNDDGTIKKYIRKWSKDRTKTNFVGFNETYGFFGSWMMYGEYVCSKKGLFGISNIAYSGEYKYGPPNRSVTFRPVIWN